MSRLRDQLAAATTERDELRHRVEALTTELECEHTARVAAQRGLVRYMREHGLADRIGYDPDAEPVLSIGAAS